MKYSSFILRVPHNVTLSLMAILYNTKNGDNDKQIIAIEMSEAAEAQVWAGSWWLSVLHWQVGSPRATTITSLSF